jgi:hypothetical protein
MSLGRLWVMIQRAEHSKKSAANEKLMHRFSLQTRIEYFCFFRGFYTVSLYNRRSKASSNFTWNNAYLIYWITIPIFFDLVKLLNVITWLFFYSKTWQFTGTNEVSLYWQITSMTWFDCVKFLIFLNTIHHLWDPLVNGRMMLKWILGPSAMRIKLISGSPGKHFVNDVMYWVMTSSRTSVE